MRAAPARLDVEGAAMRRDDALREGQADAGAAAGLPLGGEEGLEDAVAHLLRNAGSGVGHVDQHRPAWLIEVRMVSTFSNAAPFSIACWALTIRLTSTWWSWSRSPSIGRQAAGN